MDNKKQFFNEALLSVTLKSLADVDVSSLSPQAIQEALEELAVFFTRTTLQGFDDIEQTHDDIRSCRELDLELLAEKIELEVSHFYRGRLPKSSHDNIIAPCDVRRRVS